MTFCQSKGDIPYFETSAKEAINIDQAFEGILYLANPTDTDRMILIMNSDCQECPGPRGVRGVQRRLRRSD